MVSAEFQSVATVDDVTTGTIPPGQEITVTAPTICDDLSTVAAPPGTGETGAGTSYDVGSVSVDTHGQSPWHFTGQASLVLNPDPPAISHTR